MIEKSKSTIEKEIEIVVEQAVNSAFDYMAGCIDHIEFITRRGRTLKTLERLNNMITDSDGEDP